MQLPEGLKYTETHEWVRDEGDGSVTVGITSYAQDHLGELVYVELPKVGAEVRRGDACAVVESTKAASDIYAPLSGTVIAVNDALTSAAQTVNASPYDEGWLFKLRTSDAVEREGLLDAARYAQLLS